MQYPIQYLSFLASRIMGDMAYVSALENRSWLELLMVDIDCINIFVLATVSKVDATQPIG